MQEKWVLVIDRDWRLRKLIRANLEMLHIKVQEAVNEQHGLQRLKERQPDLILVGADLADREGLHVLEALCAQTSQKQVPVIMMSAEPFGLCWQQRCRVAGLLLMPFAAQDLVAAVQKALAGS